ncbi:N-alpha-acetyltransferase 40-like [Anneissia japonica]|uniref:N-alpha-acetyltransferase 40-like n=1 Tax=Anneissia japonica TaxID=1529436 RepID=UPI0014257A95|nr:N-alpha-acetyltransferase 40-like [Anneissia japonica]
MGRKSKQGKEKKMKRKEEQARYAESMAVVEAAHQLEDPMVELTAFKKYARNGLSLVLEAKKVSDLDKCMIDWAFALLKANMESLYEKSQGGWRERDKREEITHEKSWFLLAKDLDGNAVGFSHFRFDMDFDEEVLYCYEIQLESKVQRKGLGKFMMQILELIANKTKMSKVVLTVFKENKVANNFYSKTLKYSIDDTSPSIFDPMNPDLYDYEILSKKTLHKKLAEKESHAHGGGCCSGSHHHHHSVSAH